VSVYVDDINIIDKRHDINETRHHLTEFEMKDLGETKFCLGIQLEHLPSGYLYTKVLIFRECWRNSTWMKPACVDSYGSEIFRY
jgi:hypothetical protein